MVSGWFIFILLPTSMIPCPLKLRIWEPGTTSSAHRSGTQVGPNQSSAFLSLRFETIVAFLVPFHTTARRRKQSAPENTSIQPADLSLRADRLAQQSAAMKPNFHHFVVNPWQFKECANCTAGRFLSVMLGRKSYSSCSAPA